MFGARPVLLDRVHIAVRINVTGTGAIPEFADRIFCIRVLGLLVWTGLVITGVAPGAIRLKCRVLPSDGFSVGLMAVRALQIVAMIQRFIGQRCVPEFVRRPCVGVVTCIALLLGYEMTLISSGRRNTIVARRTGPQHLIMIDVEDRHPGYGGVAVLTDVCR